MSSRARVDNTEEGRVTRKFNALFYANRPDAVADFTRDLGRACPMRIERADLSCTHIVLRLVYGR